MIADPNDESPANVDAAVSIIPVLMLLSILQFRNTHPLSKMLFFVFHIQQSKVGIAWKVIIVDKRVLQDILQYCKFWMQPVEQILE